MVWWVKNEMVKLPLNTVTDDLIQYDVPDFMRFMFKTHLQLKHQRNRKRLSAAQASNTSIPLPPFTRHCEFSWNSRKPSVKFFYCKVTERKSFPQKHFSQNSAFFTDCGKKNKQFWVWKRNSGRGLDICLSSKRSLALFQQLTQMPSRLSQESLLTQTWSVLSLHSLKRPAGADSSSCKQSASREEKFSYHWNAK